MLVSKKFSFDAAHFLPNYTGKCKDLHGHHWVVEVAVEGRRDSNTGMVIDFALLKEALQPIQSLFDHRLINDVLENPTAENLAAHIYQDSWRRIQQICEYSSSLPVVIAWVRVWETEDSMAEYKGD